MSRVASERSRAGRGLTLGLTVLVALGTALWSQPVNADCVLQGEISDVTVRTSTGRHVRIEEPRQVRVSLLRRGVFSVQAIGAHATGAAGARELEGVIFAELPLTIGDAPVAIEGGSITLAPGTQIRRADQVRADMLRVEIDLGGGVQLARTWVPCASVRLAMLASDSSETEHSEASAALPSAPPVVHGAPWHPRTRRLSVFPGPDVSLHPIRLNISTPESLRFVELGREAGLVHVQCGTRAGAQIRGWVHASDLRPAARTVD